MATIGGTNGDDTLTGTSGADLINALAGADTVNAQGGADTVYGGAARDTLRGGDDDDTLYGEGDKDQLYGDAGNDTLIGGAGQDRLTGGTGSDAFVYLAAADSAGADQDVILDFAPGADLIDLAALQGAADLAWGGTTATPNGVWYQPLNGNTLVYVDLNGNTTADFRIQVNGSYALTPADFLGVAPSGGGSGPTLTSDSGAASEDNVLVANGNVLTNDSGVGLAVTALRFGAVSGTLGTALAGTYGSLTLNADGTYSYALNNAAVNVQGLTATQTVQDIFTYTATNADGSSTTLALTITGANDAASIGGASMGSVTEDGTTTATGTLSVTDPDAGQSAFQAQSNVAGTYGSFSLTTAGSWTFLLNNGAANVQALNQNQSVTETFTARSQDGTATQAVTITIHGSAESGATVINGSNSGETLNGTSGADLVNALGGADTVNAQGGDDTVYGGDARDTLRGGDGDDTLYGEGDKDALFGDAGSDTLIGGAGQDRLTGGSGNDLFRFLAASDSAGSQQDVILDFVQGQDRIDLAGLLGGATDLAWSGTKATPVPHGVWYGPSGSSTLVFADVTGDTNADFRVQVNGSFTLTPSDFLLGTPPTGGTTPPSSASDVALASEEGYPMRSRTVLGTVAIGNLLSNDDGADLVVSAVRTGGTTGTVGVALTGTYGSLTVQPDGSFEYVLANDSPLVQAIEAAVEVEDAFTYTASNAHGAAEATLSIFIFGASEESTSITGTNNGDTLTTTAGPDLINALAGPDLVNAQAGEDVVHGGEGDDTLDGGADDDQLFGDAGDDTLTGGLGLDRLSGGPGGDVFGYLVVGDSTAVVPDVILDFVPGQDRIDLSALLGTTHLAWGGTTATPNGVWFETVGGNTFVQADVTGDASADLGIQVSGIVALARADFFGVVQAGGTAPNLVSDGAIVAEDGVSAANGNVLTNDGGSGLSVTAVRFGATNGTIGSPLAGTCGSLAIGADGAYTYIVNNAAANVQALVAGQVAQDVFTYTASSPGGTAQATLTVSIVGADEGALLVTSMIGTDNGETLTGTPGPDVINARGGGDTVDGLGGDDTIYGGDGGDLIHGGDGDDLIVGQGDIKYQDSLYGDAGDDTLVGGPAHDHLDGGPGSDRFVVPTAEDSTPALQDVIVDFEQGQDRIDFSGLLGVVDLVWGGTTATPNGVWFGAGSTTNVYADVTGDTTADVRVQVNGSFTFTPADFLGVVQSGNGGSPPDPASDAATVAEDNVLAANGNVLTNDTGGALSVTALRFGATNGTVGTALAGVYGTLTLAADGYYTYTLDNAGAIVQALAAGQSLQEVFAYTATNGKGSNEATLTVTITGANDAPTAAGTTVPASEDTTLNGVLPAATDVDGDTVSYAPGGAATNGAALVNGDGTFSYTPDGNFNGGDSFGYTVSDGQGGSNGYTVTVNVAAANDPAVITGDVAGSVAEDGTLTAGGTLTATDPDAGESAFQTQTDAAGSYGAFSIDANGGWSYSLGNDLTIVQELTGGAIVTDTFTTTSLDGSATQDVIISITGVNETLTAGPGDETLDGGAGPDAFIFTDGFGADTITNFVSGEDLIDLSGMTNPDWTTFAEVQAAASQVGLDTMVDLGNGNTITLVGVTAANLTAGDFQL